MAPDPTAPPTEFADDTWKVLLQRMFHESPVGISLTAVDGSLARANHAFAAMLGYTTAELNAKGFADITHPDDLKDSQQFVADCLSGKRSDGQMVKRYKHRDGRDVWADVHSVLLRDGDGKPVHFVTHIVDITRRRNAEFKFQTMFENVAEAVFLATPEGRYIDANRSACQLLGRTKEQIVGMTMRDIAHPDDLAVRPPRLAELRSGAPMLSRRRLLHADGTVLHTEIMAQAQPDGTLVGLVRDITEQVRDEDLLRAKVRIAEVERHDSLDAAIQTALDEAETLTDSRIAFFHFVEPDQVTLQLQTWSRRTLAEACTAGQRGEHYPVDSAGVWADCVRQRKPIVHNDFATVAGQKGMPDGHTPVVRELTVPIIRGDLVVAVIGVGNKAVDYTERDLQAVSELATTMIDLVLRRRAEDALRQHRDHLDELVQERTAELARSNRELEQFAFVASHDLNEPLRKIQAFGDLLVTDFADKLQGEGLDYLNRMTQAATRLRSMIDSLLSYSRVTSRARPFVAVSLTELVGEVLHGLEPRIAEVAGQVSVGALPDVFGDRAQLAQLLQNLIENALKFVPKGRAPQVQVRGRVQGGKVVLEVEDNGIGIEPQHRTRIFGMFQRLHGIGEYGGSGIGLAICEKIAQRHGGTIRVEGVEPQGSRFVVELALMGGE